MTQPAETTTEPPKRMNPNKLRQTIYWLTLDWLYLTTHMPIPSTNDPTRRRSNAREYGHPAEWASTQAAEIADILTSWHDDLAEHRGETRPRKARTRRKDDGTDAWIWAVNQRQRITTAWRYLEPRIEELCQLHDHETLEELPNLHYRIRRALGHTKPRYTLPVPCPSTDCGLRTLERCIGIGQDFIICGACGYTVRDDPAGNNYRWLVRVCLDTLIATPATT